MLTTRTRRAQHAGAAVKYNLFILYMAQADDVTGKGPTSEGRERPSKWKTRSPSAQVKSARLSGTVERPEPAKSTSTTQVVALVRRQWVICPTCQAHAGGLPKKPSIQTPTSAWVGRRCACDRQTYRGRRLRQQTGVSNQANKPAPCRDATTTTRPAEGRRHHPRRHHGAGRTSTTKRLKAG